MLDPTDQTSSFSVTIMVGSAEETSAATFNRASADVQHAARG